MLIDYARVSTTGQNLEAQIEHQQDQVRTMLHEEQSMRAIARHFNVGVATIDRIKRSTHQS